MPTLLTRDRHLAGLREAVAVLERYADRAGPGRRQAMAELLHAHAAAPAAARDHWARRACHEATLLALQVEPAIGAGAWLEPDLAADGVDELLAACRLRPAEAGVLVVRPVDRHEWWALELGAHRPRLTRHAGEVSRDATWELTGSVVELFVRLAARGPMSSHREPGLTARGPTHPSREARS